MLAPGTKIGHYSVVSTLGAGGMGEVYRATDTRLGREVALKVLPEAVSRDADKMARFAREAQLLAALHHTNIAAVYGLEESEGVRALIMELVEGPTLAEKIAHNAAAVGASRGSGTVPMSIDDSLAIAKQIADALEAAHEKGIIHRDLKPANVMVTADGAVKVLDFGLAKAIEGTDSSGSLDPATSPTLTMGATKAGLILGTAAYMSPEQARGKSVDRRADIWAFGVVLYEMLTGKQAFSGETVSDTLAAVLTREPDLSDLPANTPGKIKELLRRCLHKDPKKRLQAIGEARITIEHVQSGADLSSAESAVAPGSIHRLRNLWLWLGATAIVASGLAVFATLRWSPSPPESPLRFLKLDIHNFRSGTISRPSLSPDGKTVAYITDGKLLIHPFEESKPREVASGFPGNMGALIWSADSRSLAYSHQGRLYRVPAAGGSPTEICRLPDAIIDGVWSTDGQIVISQWRGGLYQVSAQGGEPKLLVANKPESEVDFHSPLFLPGKNILMYSVHPLIGNFWVEAFIDNQRKVIREGEGVYAYVDTGHLLIGGRQGGTWAVPFSLSTLAATAEPFKVADGLILNISGDGAMLYMDRGESEKRQIVWVNRAGEIQEKIGEPMERLNTVALSHDQKRIAFSAQGQENTDIWTHDLVRNVRTLVAGTEKAELNPAWSADDRNIYYTAREGMGASLWVRPSDGTGDARALGTGANPSLTKSGEFLAYIVPGQDAKTEFWYLKTDPVTASPVGGTQPIRYLPLRDPAGRIWVSPDGKLAAYRSVATGDVEIYLSRFPSGEGRWRVSVDGGAEALWNPRGGELFYVDRAGILFSAQVSTIPDVRLGKPQRMFSLREKNLNVVGFSVTADGSRFLMVQDLSGGASSRGMYLVQDWPALLRRALKK